MEKSTQLPVEAVNEINAKAIEIALKFIPDINSPGYRAIKGAAIKGATAYATKWFSCFEENGKLATTIADNIDKIKVLTYDNNKLKGEVEGLQNAVEESALYETRLALYDMIRATKGVIENRGTILNARKRIEAAEGILNKHFKITDVLRDESAAGREDAVDVDELWDEHAEYIDDNIDELVRWAGSTVVTREQFNKMMAKFKQQKEK